MELTLSKEEEPLPLAAGPMQVEQSPSKPTDLRMRLSGTPLSQRSMSQDQVSDRMSLDSPTMSGPKSTSPLKDSDGGSRALSNPKQRLRGTAWAVTVQLGSCSLEKVAAWLKKNERLIKYVLIGPEEESSENGRHHHMLVEFHERQWQGIWGDQLLSTTWIKPIEARGDDTRLTALKRYKNYCLKEGKAVLEKGTWTRPPMLEDKLKGPVMMQIKQMIEGGALRSSVVSKYPAQVNQITKLMFLRKPRKIQTRCLYIHGRMGTGKSSAIFDSMDAIQRTHPEFKYHSKMGGLGKFWDGYDNEPVVVIDDPAVFDVKYDQKEIIYFKNLISNGPMEIEVKCGAMQFDSPLVIMSSNIDPEVLAISAGKPHEAAVWDRIAGSRSVIGKAVYVDTDTYARKKLPFKLITLIARMMYDIYDLEINVQACMDNIVHTNWSAGYSDIF